MTDNFSQALYDLFAQSEPIHYRKGRIVHRPDDTHKGVYFVEKGNIKAYSISAAGSEHLHIIYKPGEMFPLRWIFSNIQGETFYETMTPVILRKLTKEKFLEGINAQPTLARELIQKIIDFFDTYIARVDNLQHTTTHRRLIAMLLFLAKRFGNEEGEKIVFTITLTHQDMANLINMARETVSRELELLKEKNIVSTNDHYIVIHNIDKLKREFHR